LRAASNLARLLKSQGREAEADAVLRPVYGWFTEGFEFPDLRRARALLD
jgi:predicted ATPase